MSDADAIPATNVDAWNNVLCSASEGDVYFDPQYHRANANDIDAEATAFVYREGSRQLFHPILHRRIFVGDQDSGWKDFETVYGYTGPISTTNEPGFLLRAWDAFSQWCSSERIVAGFVRFNPFLSNHRLVPPDCTVTLDRDVVVVDLSGGKDVIWSRYPSVQRNMIRKAMRSGLLCEETPVESGLEAFREIYEASMSRLRASRAYFFTDRYYRTLIDGLRQNIRLLTVLQDGRPVAAALFMLYRDRIHYHLAGSRLEARPFAPNNLLLHYAIEWGAERGYRWLSLGGGTSPSLSDPLYSFKAGVSNGRLPFHTGQWLIDARAYEQLCQHWVERHPGDNRSNYFLRYRLGAAN